MASLGSLGHTSSALGSGNLLPSQEEIFACCLLVVFILSLMDALIRKIDRNRSKEKEQE